MMIEDRGSRHKVSIFATIFTQSLISDHHSYFTRLTRLATRYWGYANEISAVWGFDDAESGIKSIRASFSRTEVSPIEHLRDMAGFAGMQYVLPVRADQRRGLLPLASQGIMLRHNLRLYLHMCAEDHMYTLRAASRTSSSLTSRRRSADLPPT